MSDILNGLVPPPMLLSSQERKTSMIGECFVVCGIDTINPKPIIKRNYGYENTSTLLKVLDITLASRYNI